MLGRTSPAKPGRCSCERSIEHSTEWLLEVGEHQDVELPGARRRTDGVDALSQAAVELIRTQRAGAYAGAALAACSAMERTAGSSMSRSRRDHHDWMPVSGDDGNDGDPLPQTRGCRWSKLGWPGRQSFARLGGASGGDSAVLRWNEARTVLPRGWRPEVPHGVVTWSHHLESEVRVLSTPGFRE